MNRWQSINFAHPWLLLLLLLLPILAVLAGRRGAAPAVVFSSLRPFHGLGRVPSVLVGVKVT